MFSGSIVALVTPMEEGGSVDWVALERLLAFHMENGTHAVVVVGTSGESPTLPIDEHIEVIRRAVSCIAGEIPVIAGTGANSTAEALNLTQQAKEAGADACLLVTPYYNKPTQEGLYQHFKLIADRVDIPQIMYTVPGRTAVDFLPDTVDRLASHENIVGLKDATGNLDYGREVIKRCADRIAIYSGDDATAMQLIMLGAKGDISVTANVAPQLMAQMCTAALAGELQTAVQLNERLNALHRDLFLESNPIPVKWAVAELGLIKKGIRLPLTWLSENCHQQVRNAMRQAGVLN